MVTFGIVFDPKWSVANAAVSAFLRLFGLCHAELSLVRGKPELIVDRRSTSPSTRICASTAMPRSGVNRPPLTALAPKPDTMHSPD